jgi:hypothetical protein
MQTAEVHNQLTADVASYMRDPHGFAYYIYPWGDGELADFGPRGTPSGVSQGRQ